jgi:hypothetical protein
MLLHRGDGNGVCFVRVTPSEFYSWNREGMIGTTVGGKKKKLILFLVGRCFLTNKN